MVKWPTILILLCANTAAAQCPLTPPSTYLANTSRTVFSDAVVPNFGNAVGAGTVVTDTTYYAPGLRTMRMTDTTIGGVTLDGKTESYFNCNSTYLIVNDESGDYNVLNFAMGVTPTLAAHPPQGHTGGDQIASANFSHSNPNMLYLLVWDPGDSHAKFSSFDMSTGAYTVMHDAQSDIPTLGAYGASLVVSEDDNCFSGNIGGTQDLRRYFYIWCAATQGGFTAGARWLDGSTGIIAGWGSTGTITSGVRWGGHAYQVFGRYGTITIGSCLAGSPCSDIGDGLIWDILGTAANGIQFFALTTSDYPINVEGHFTTDINGVLVDASAINGGTLDRTKRTIDSSLASYGIANANRVDLIPTPRSPDTFNSDAHASWQNNRVGQSLPTWLDLQWMGDRVTAISRTSNVVTVSINYTLFCSNGQTMVVRNVTGGATSFNGSFTVASNSGNCNSLTYAQTGPNESGTVSITSSIQPIAAHPWDNEIIALAIDGTNTVYRFAHTYGNTQETPLFQLQTSNRISMDGRYVAWHSDMRQSLGVDGAGISRTDVFVTELPFASAALTGGGMGTGTKIYPGTKIQ